MSYRHISQSDRNIKWAGRWENVSYVICEQQRRRSACASAQSEQRFCRSLLRYYNISRFYNRDFKTPAGFCGCAGRFQSGLVGNSRRHILSCRGSNVIKLTSMNVFFKITYTFLIENQMSRDMSKPTKRLCAQRRLRSVWASAQSDQSLRCALNG